MARLVVRLAGAGLLLSAMPAGAQAPAAADLLFQAEGQTLSGTCTGQPVVLEGNHNMVTLTGQCGSLLLKGVGNMVQMGIRTGGSIHVEGSGNRVSYGDAGAAPATVMLGPDNEVASGPAQPASPQPPAPPPPVPPPAVPAPAPPPAAASAQPAPPPLAAAATGPLLLAGDDQQRLGECTGRDVTVTGLRSAYVLRGGCKSLTLRGDLLSVQAEMAPAARITVNGQGSIVSWVVPPKARPPATAVHGDGSRTQRAETIGGEPPGSFNSRSVKQP